MLVRPCVGQALANDALQALDGALAVIHAQSRALFIAELKFSQIAVLVLFAAVLVNALHAALEDAEVTLHSVAVDGAVGLTWRGGRRDRGGAGQ